MNKNIKKGIKASVLIIALLVTSGIGCFAVEETVSVFFNNEQLEFDATPEIVNGRTMVPLAKIFEALGMAVVWNGDNQSITAVKDDLEIVLMIESVQAYMNGLEYTLDAEPYIVDGRTMVPLAFIAESTGAQVEWDGSDRSVKIYTAGERTYKIVDTGVETFFTDDREISNLEAGQAFYGQDANYSGYQPSYRDNGDGTVTDDITGLMWQQTMEYKMTYAEALEYANASKLGGYDDWRFPSIKELFSLIQFTGSSGGDAADILYIDTDYFDQPIGDTSLGEREIDAQTWSSTEYVGVTMMGDATVFGVNFVDGRIKGYPKYAPRTRAENELYVRLVRGNESYGQNVFVDNGDGTISDLATGLMWQMADDGITRDWEDALGYAEDLTLAGYDDWRLPNVKELQSIVDYSRSLQTTNSPAIDDLFVLSEIQDPDGDANYGFYWSSTTHQDGKNKADAASYVAFGEAQGSMQGKLLDVHGCGAVRSDPKSGPASNYPAFQGPQGDVRYVYNYVLAVRDISE